MSVYIYIHICYIYKHTSVYTYTNPAYIHVRQSCVNQFGIFNLLCWIQQMKNIITLNPVINNIHLGGVVGGPMIHINKLGRTEFTCINHFDKSL